jgi:hypothetical protein
MLSQRERRAAALEAIGNALLELAAVERASEEVPETEVLIDRRNCRKELGLPAGAFIAAAGREFPAFRVSRKTTATKADVLAWLKTRRFTPAPTPPKAPLASDSEPDAFLKAVDACFVARVGRAMTDDELNQADMWIDAGRSISHQLNRAYTDTPDEVAARVESKIGKERPRHADWRSLGLDVADMERKAEELRERLHAEHPEWTWRERINAIYAMWSETTEPLTEARRAARKAARDARKLAGSQTGKSPRRAR